MTRIFNSWQSDLPSKTNRSFIQDALKQLGTANTEWYFDEATRDCPGSPDIAIALENKIRKSDIFIADISITNPTYDGKKTPNPNVLFELGIAQGVLGWERIILIVNEQYGSVKEMPFDISKHRAIVYNFAKDPKKNLSKIIKVAIEQIEVSNPPKQIYKEQSVEEIKHSRDVNTLTGLLNYIDLTALSQRANEGARYLQHSVINYSDFLNIALSDVTFSLYNKDLENLIRNIQHELNLSFNGNYKDVGNNQFDVWSLPGDIFPSKAEENRFEKVNQACQRLGQLVHNFSEIIKNSYLEIDLEKTNLAARKFLYSA